jgi:hypothetical protein
LGTSADTNPDPIVVLEHVAAVESAGRFDPPDLKSQPAQRFLGAGSFRPALRRSRP